MVVLKNLLINLRFGQKLLHFSKVLLFIFSYRSVACEPHAPI